MITLIAGMALLTAQGKTGPWISLFDGKTLTGWSQHNGTAPYSVENGTLVGRTAKGSPNSFLGTTKEYGDFELEFEVKVHNNLNSGVQIRSRDKTEEDVKVSGGPLGRFHGPQVEIEASPGQSGYIYGEATEFGWLSPEPESQDKAVNEHSIFKNGEWNQYRIVAFGPRIQTFINGKKVADLTNEVIYKRHPKGLIGLQVHGIGENEGPYDVAWRKLRLRELK